METHDMEMAETMDAGNATVSSRNKAPVFVLGCPRSGTTLLYHMLLSAGNFAIYRAESQVFNLLEPRFGDLSIAANKRRLLQQWQKTTLFSRTGLSAAEVETDVMEGCTSGGDFLRIVMEAIARKQGVERWAECTPDHLLAIPRIKQTIPNALVIHIIRDGRDVALSLERQHWIRPFPWDHGKELLSAALYWDWIVNKGREYGRQLGNDYAEVRYEELVADPRRALAGLEEFVGQELNYDRIQRVGIGSVSRPNSSFGKDAQSGGFQPIARWKSALSGPSLREVESLIGETLAALDYEVDTKNVASAPGVLKRMRTIYHAHFSTKLALKTKTPLGRWLGGDLEFLGMDAEGSSGAPDTREPAKILQIGNYPPPMCGWAIQLKLVTEELRRRGHICDVMKINEGRQIKSSEYVDVQGGVDYLSKIWRYTRRGYRLNVHVNGMSKKGYYLAMAAALMGRLVNRPALVTFHGGLSQDYFPKHDSSFTHHAFYALFRMAGEIACDSEPIRDAIAKYGIRPDKIQPVATFSPQYLQFNPIALSEAVERFLGDHGRVFLSYVSFRAEYRLDILREGMRKYRELDPTAGFVWLGFPGKEMPAAENYVSKWPADERASLLLLGNLSHDEFLTLLSRCFVYLRTPACDGVAASVLESLALGVPVVASENGRRPQGVVTYRDTDSDDMVEKLRFVAERYEQVKASLHTQTGEDNVGKMADWLVGESVRGIANEPIVSR